MRGQQFASVRGISRNNQMRFVALTLDFGTPFRDTGAACRHGLARLRPRRPIRPRFPGRHPRRAGRKPERRGRRARPRRRAGMDSGGRAGHGRGWHGRAGSGCHWRVASAKQVHGPSSTPSPTPKLLRGRARTLINDSVEAGSSGVSHWQDASGAYSDYLSPISGCHWRAASAKRVHGPSSTPSLTPKLPRGEA